MAEIWELIKNFALESGIAKFFVEGGWKNLIMIVLACVLLFLAIKKGFDDPKVSREARRSKNSKKNSYNKYDFYFRFNIDPWPKWFSLCEICLTTSR